MESEIFGKNCGGKEGKTERKKSDEPTARPMDSLSLSAGFFCNFGGGFLGEL